MDRKIFEEGIGILDLMTKLNLTKSNSEARRLIQGGGVSIDGEKVQDPNLVVKASMFTDDKLILQKGKKVHQRITLV